MSLEDFGLTLPDPEPAKDSKKTLVVAKHEHGPAVNGHDGCHARFSTGGFCPGIEIARWLNSLGDDDEQYIKYESGKLGETNGNVRDNWLNAVGAHVVAKYPYLAKLKAEQRRLRAELRIVERKITECGLQEKKS